MALFEVRPRFVYQASCDADFIKQKVRTLLNDHPEDLVGRIEGNHIKIRIVESKRHFWSPQLSLNIEETSEGIEVRGMFGPKPDIWLMYMFTYIFLGFATFIAGMYGLSRYHLGMESYILWAIPFALGGIIALWISSQVGQRLGKKETEMMQEAIQFKMLEDCVDIS